MRWSISETSASRSSAGGRAGRRLVFVGTAVSIALAVLTPSIPAGASGALSLSGFAPKSGAVGTKVTISGTGFVTSDIVRFNGTTAKVKAVNAGGTTLTTSVPALATTGIVTVTDPASGQTVGLPNSPFTVTTGIFATPNRVWAGGRFTLEGSGLSPDHTDPLQIANLTVAQVRIDSNGNFTIGVSVPWLDISGLVHLRLIDISGPITTILWILGAWPMYRHDSQHTGVDTYETSLSVNNVGAMKQLWMKNVDSTSTFSMIPSVANGLVYESANEPSTYNMWAFTTDGKKMPWYASGYVSSSLGTEPAVANGNLYYAAANAINPIDASLDAATGTQNWASGLSLISPYSPSAPNVVGGSMYLGAPDGNLYSLSTSTGKVQWSYQTGGAVHSSPAYDKGIVYVGSDSGVFSAVHAGSGLKDWTYPFKLGAIDSSPAVVGGIVYVGSDNGSVIALNAATGAEVWHDTFNGEGFRASPVVVNGVVYIGGGTAQTGDMYALNASTGKTVWTFKTGPGVSDAAYANGVLYFSDLGDNVVRALDASNANALWKNYSVASPLAPIISNGIVFVEGHQAMYAFSL